MASEWSLSEKGYIRVTLESPDSEFKPEPRFSVFQVQKARLHGREDGGFLNTDIMDIKDLLMYPRLLSSM